MALALAKGYLFVGGPIEHGKGIAHALGHEWGLEPFEDCAVLPGRDDAAGLQANKRVKLRSLALGSLQFVLDVLRLLLRDWRGVFLHCGFGCGVGALLGLGELLTALLRVLGHLGVLVLFWGDSSQPAKPLPASIRVFGTERLGVIVRPERNTIVRRPLPR